MDMVPSGDGGDAYLARPGGCAYTTAIAAARLGAEVEFLGRIGTDFLGEALAERLAANGVGTRFTARRDDPATLAFVKRSPSGDARYAFYSKGAADRSLSPDDVPPELDGEPGFIMFGSISMAQEPVASTIEALIARESGPHADPRAGKRPRLPRSQYQARPHSGPRGLPTLLRPDGSLSAIVKASSEDIEWLYPDLSEAAAVERMLASGPELVVVTRGPQGALAATKREKAESEGMAVEVADTIGAGDTFHAALLFSSSTTTACERGRTCRPSERGDCAPCSASRTRPPRPIARAPAPSRPTSPRWKDIYQNDRKKPGPVEHPDGQARRQIVGLLRKRLHGTCPRAGRMHDALVRRVPRGPDSERPLVSAVRPPRRGGERLRSLEPHRRRVPVLPRVRARLRGARRFDPGAWLDCERGMDRRDPRHRQRSRSGDLRALARKPLVRTAPFLDQARAASSPDSPRTTAS